MSLLFDQNIELELAISDFKIYKSILMNDVLVYFNKFQTTKLQEIKNNLNSENSIYYEDEKNSLMYLIYELDASIIITIYNKLIYRINSIVGKK